MDGRLRGDLDRSARTAIAGFRRLVSTRKRFSRSVSMVVLQQAAEAFPAPDLAIHSADFVAWFEKTVVETLVVSAPMVVVEIQRDGLTQHSLQAFGLERPKISRGADSNLVIAAEAARTSHLHLRASHGTNRRTYRRGP